MKRRILVFDNVLKYRIGICQDPPFSIVKRTLPRGTRIKGYDAEEGRMIQGALSSPVTFTYLRVAADGNEVLLMADDPMEYGALLPHVRNARGRVLVGGLGLGMYPVMLVDKGNMERIDRIDIVEIEPKIIGLVEPQISHPKIRVIHDDIYNHLSTTLHRYDYVYHDIWPHTTGPLLEADKLLKLSERVLTSRGTAHVWLEELCKRVRSRLPKKPMSPKQDLTLEPCLFCGKFPRNDYAGLCMDCADIFHVSEMFIRRDGDEREESAGYPPRESQGAH